MCVALAALAAVVRVTGKNGERTIPFAEFHRLPGDTPQIDTNLCPDELITGIDLPAKGFAEHSAYLKHATAPHTRLRWSRLPRLSR